MVPGRTVYITCMPRGNPKRAILIRLDPATIAEVQSYAGPRNLTSAIEAGLAWWLKQARRKAAAEPTQRRRSQGEAA
jgi:hypothetical protein